MLFEQQILELLEKEKHSGKVDFLNDLKKVHHIHVIKQLCTAFEEANRLESLSNKELIAECLETNAADYLVVIEMMNRLFPGWEKEIFTELQ